MFLMSLKNWMIIECSVDKYPLLTDTLSVVADVLEERGHRDCCYACAFMDKFFIIGGGYN